MKNIFKNKIFITVLFSLGVTSTLFASSLTIGANSTLDLSNASLVVPSNVTINGNLETAGAVIDVGGSFLNNGSVSLSPTSQDLLTIGSTFINTGSFDNGIAQVTFNATSGTHTVNPGGDSFYDVIFNDSGGTAVWQLGGNLVVTRDISIEGGTLDASTSNYSITVSRNWANSDIFLPREGTVEFIDNSKTSTVSGNTTFYNFKCATANKQINFTASSTQTINNSFNIAGSSGSEVILRSTNSGVSWNVDCASAQNVSYVNVQRSDASLGESITASGSLDSGNNLNWVFSTVSVTSPTDGSTIGRLPTIRGTASAGDTITIKGIKGGVLTDLATTTADANGNFRTELQTGNELDVMAGNQIFPYVGSSPGTSVTVNVVAAPNVNQVPAIDSPTDQEHLTSTTPTVTGRGVSSQAVEIVAEDQNGDLQVVGTGTTNASGEFSIILSTALPAGTNGISATVGDTTSNITTVYLVDPWGIVYDSITNNPIQNAIVTLWYNHPVSGWIEARPGVEIAAGDSNPQTTSSNGIFSFNSQAGGTYKLTVSANNYAFPSSVIAMGSPYTGSHGENFTVNVPGPVVRADLPMDGGIALLEIKKTANKKEAVIGDIVTYTVEIKNNSSTDISGIYIQDRIPAGFKYLSGKTRLDKVQTADPSGSRNLTFSTGTISSGDTKILKYQLIVGTGVNIGNHDNKVFAQYQSGTRISNFATATVKIIPDPLFNCLVVGKVFWDKNENGVQDKEEPGIEGVEILTHEGTTITTDKFGRYNLPAVTGRVLLRINEKTLPVESSVISDNPLLVDVKEGFSAKANFAVQVKDSSYILKESKTRIATKDNAEPFLTAGIFNNKLYICDSVLINNAIFKIVTNLTLFIDTASIEIRDSNNQLLEEIVIPAELINGLVIWDGNIKNAKLKPGEFFYKAVLKNKNGVLAESVTNKFAIIEASFADVKQTSINYIINTDTFIEWMKLLRQYNSITSLDLKNKGLSVIIEKRSDWQSRYLKDDLNETPLTFFINEKEKKIFKSSLLDSELPYELILPEGNYTVVVNETFHTYERSFESGDDHLIFLALADAEIGYNSADGEIEPVQSNDRFKNGFWQDGKMAFYLKGKIKGKYLIKASLDTERKRKELFKMVDPEKYYPVYGDASKINYEDSNTQGILYASIQWDKSEAVWGNFETAIKDTSLVHFNKSLYGSKIKYETLQTNSFGDADTKIIVFAAQAKQKSAENQFLSTGGFIYFLKHKNVIEGSENVRIQIRDAVTSLVLSEETLTEGKDYEISYSDGKLVLFKYIARTSNEAPVAQAISISGNPVYVVVNYEYDVNDTVKFRESSYGVRFSKVIANYLRVGATYVQDEQQTKNYKLHGYDATLYIGNRGKVQFEYAQTNAAEFPNYMSTDGGSSFTEVSSDDLDEGGAYLVNGNYDFGLFNSSFYYQNIRSGFSNESQNFSGGETKWGIAVFKSFANAITADISYGEQTIFDDANLISQYNTGARKTRTLTALVSKNFSNGSLAVEYLYQDIQGKSDIFSERYSNKKTSLVALKEEYRITDDTNITLRQQIALKGDENHAVDFGIYKRIFSNIVLNAVQTFGHESSATKIGLAAKTEKINIHAEKEFSYGTKGFSDTVLGVDYDIDENTQVYTKYSLKEDLGQNASQLIYGQRKQLSETIETRAEKIITESVTEQSSTEKIGFLAKINEFLTLDFGLENGLVYNYNGSKTDRTSFALVWDYQYYDIFKNKVMFESRFDTGETTRRQIFLKSLSEWHIDNDLTLFNETEISYGKDSSTGECLQYYKDILFGFAYRPVYNDRLNFVGKYSFYDGNAPEDQQDYQDIERARKHTFSLDTIYQINRKLELTGKTAVRLTEEKVVDFDQTRSLTYFVGGGLIYEIVKNWKIAAYYSKLFQKQAKDSKGVLQAEIIRKIGKELELALGYSFTDFKDKMYEDMGYKVKGVYFRASGKLTEKSFSK